METLPHGGIGASLVIYGPLGVFVVILMVAVVKLYRDLDRERKAHRKTSDEWQERHVKKAESWMDRYQDLAKSITTVIESLERRYERR